ncbi:F-box/WD repeat-containing protein [Criblamydia sequanensis]|uniref:F-box and WD repeat-containing protein n=1 Tax=Candidatus Criblamydia sequanensis CRIB-18 TaxID=1437425 RepID=A0A090D2P9_9BACT|nr:F-box/WD40 repeat-containing protein [Criblamydia sequanensis]CDR34815.1 F-box and WD repeat-containing protein [Criblamydia sequanensis CRIB-18]
MNTDGNLTAFPNTPSFHPRFLERKETDIHAIPYEVMLQIFEKLDLKSIFRAAPTCKLWTTLSKDISLLRHLFHKYLPDTAKASPKTNLDENFFLQHLIGDARIRSKSFEIKPILTEIKTDGFISCLKLINGKLFVGTTSSIDIWDTKTEHKVKSFKGDFSMISAIEVADGKLFSPFSDKTIHIKDIESGETLKVLAGHTNLITKIYVSNGKIISKGLCENLRIWDALTGDLIRVIDSKISDFWSDDGKIFALYYASDEGIIHLWNIETGELKSFEGHRDLTFLTAANGKLFSALEDMSICIWDAESGKQLRTFKEHTDRIINLEIVDNKLISYAYDCKICIWDIETGTLLRKLDTSNLSEDKKPLGISSVQIEGGKIFAAAHNKTIQIWNFNQNAKNPIK